MTGTDRECRQLLAFYEEAKEALTKIAKRHSLSVPAGHVALEPNVLHWRLTAHLGSPEDYWGELWVEHATKLGLGLMIEPGDLIIDQEGRSWTLLGLDPSSTLFPVRLIDSGGVIHSAPLEAAQLFQLLSKGETTHSTTDRESEAHPGQ